MSDRKLTLRWLCHGPEPPEARKADPDPCAPARLGTIRRPCAGCIVRSRIASSRTSSTQSAKSNHSTADKLFAFPYQSGTPFVRVTHNNGRTSALRMSRENFGVHVNWSPQISRCQTWMDHRRQEGRRGRSAGHRQATGNGVVAIDPHTTRSGVASDHSLAVTNDDMSRL